MWYYYHTTRTHPNFLSSLITKNNPAHFCYSNKVRDVLQCQSCRMYRVCILVTDVNQPQKSPIETDLHQQICRHSQVSVLHSCSDKNRSRWKQERRAWGVFFPSFWWLGSYQDAAVRSHGGSFQHPLTGPLFSGQTVSLCFSACFKMAVHRSVKLPRWALSVAWLLVNVHCWIPLNHAAF